MYLRELQEIKKDKKALKLDVFYYNHSENNKYHYSKAQLFQFLYKSFLFFYAQLNTPPMLFFNLNDFSLN